MVEDTLARSGSPLSRPVVSAATGPVVVVTGATSGIGLAVARQLRATGARVVGTGRDQGRLQDLASTVDLALTLDVTDQRSVDMVQAAVLDRYGHVDAVVNNAGIGHFAPWPDTTIDAFERVLDVDLLGCVRVAQAFLPAMVEAGTGCLVNIASVAGLRGYPKHTAYCAAKHGLIGWSRALHKDLQGTGVAVVVVCPPAVDTPFFERAGYFTWKQDHPGFQPMSADAVASGVVRALQRRPRQVVLSRRAQLLYAVDTVAPGLIDGLQAWKNRRWAASGNP